MASEGTPSLRLVTILPGVVASWAYATGRWDPIANRLATGLLAACLVASVSYIQLLRLPFPDRLKIHPSISTIDEETPASRRFKELYPEDIFEGGGYAALPYGKTKYYLFGSEDGKKVVLIAGLAMPAPIWEELVPHLEEHCRVLIYDHYGRGYSEAPETEYTANFYTTQLALLMQHLGWSQAHIVGVSMGGGIAAAFATSFPKLVQGKLVLISPAGLVKNSQMALKGKIIAYPPINYVITSSLFRWYLTHHPMSAAGAGGSLKSTELLEIAALQQQVLPYHVGAVASSVRHAPIRGLEKEYALLGANPDVRTLVFWGTDDDIVPFSLAVDLYKLLPQGIFVTIDGGTHDICVSHCSTIGPQIQKFLLA